MLLGPHIYPSLFPRAIQLATANISETLPEDTYVWLAREAGPEAPGS